ncbi:hypothetical protein EJB05_33806, partial [Eragrostis curvula]
TSPESPEVSIVGERSFNSKCNNLSGSSDQVYNMSFASYQAGYGTQVLSGENIAVHRIRRVMNPSKFMSYPYVNSVSKVQVTKKEIDVYKVALELGHSEHSDQFAIDFKNVKVKFFALELSLKPSGKVMSYVVNAWCKRLFKDNHPRDTRKHFFFSTCGDFFLEKYSNYEEKRKLYEKCIYCFNGASYARLLYTSHRLYFPINHLNHWFVIVVDLNGRNYFVLEPNLKDYAPKSEYYANVMRMFKKNFFSIWEETGKLDMGIKYYEFHFVDVPQINHPNDDGVHIMKCLQLWDPNVYMMDKFSPADVPNIRIKCLNDMVFSEDNVATNSVSIIKRHNREVYNKYFKGG